MFRRALELDPSNATARLALARSETEKGNYQRSLDLAAPVLPAFTQSPDGLLVLATNYLKTGESRARSRSGRGLDAAFRRAPGMVDQVRAARLSKRDAFAEAIDVLERARLTGPPSYELAFNLGGAYLLNGDPAKALDAYDLALTLKADSLPALRQAAAIAEQQGELERSLSYWMRARKIAPDEPEILLGFGRVCLKMDLLEDAEPALTKAASTEARRALLPVHAGRREGGKAAVRSRQGLLEPLVRSGPTTRSCNMRWARSCISRDVSTRQPRVCGRASGCSRSSWRPTITSRWSPETRATMPRPSRCSSDCFSAIPITPRPARRWADC